LRLQYVLDNLLTDSDEVSLTCWPPLIPRKIKTSKNRSKDVTIRGKYITRAKIIGQYLN
jgi:hypothetical protein